MAVFLICVFTYIAIVIGLFIQASFFELPTKIPNQLMIVLPFLIVLLVIEVAIKEKKISALSLLLSFSELCTVSLVLFSDALIQARAAARTRKQQRSDEVTRKAYAQGKLKLNTAIGSLVA